MLSKHYCRMKVAVFWKASPFTDVSEDTFNLHCRENNGHCVFSRNTATYIGTAERHKPPIILPHKETVVSSSS